MSTPILIVTSTCPPIDLLFENWAKHDIPLIPIWFLGYDRQLSFEADSKTFIAVRVWSDRDLAGKTVHRG